jgi:YNFM family putative membrane transporter
MPPAPEHPAKAAPVYAVRGSTAFLKISFALFLAGFSTFSLLYCIQPLLPLFARDLA